MLHTRTSALAATYRPLPVTIVSAEGAYVTDDAGRRYLDCLSAYSAMNFGHRHPAVISAVTEQLDRVTLTSRAFGNDQLEPFAAELAELCGTNLVVPMNTGAEAVESAIKIARAWGYRRRGVRPDRATIVVAGGNFHGRTTTIVSFSDDPVARQDFGPFTPGFKAVPFGDADAIAQAIDDDTVAVLIEPIQGEAGVIVPPDTYLPAVRELCTNRGVLLILDEIQSGLARTGKTFAAQHWDVTPDLMTLGKALGGGVIPVSAVVGSDEVVGVLGVGEHGSTFGGNPLAAAAARAVIRLLESGEFQARSTYLGALLHGGLRDIPAVTATRGLGLWAGVDIAPEWGSARSFCEGLAERGILAKDTHGQTIRIAPPLTIDESDVLAITHAIRETAEAGVAA